MKNVVKFLPLYLLTGILFIIGVLGMDRAITTVGESIPPERSHVIVIDAGHGGEDGGAVSCTGAMESHINLQIALRLEDLCHLMGYKTHMIRTDDVAVYTEGKTIASKKASDLRQRARTVNQIQGAVLISIHQNIFPDGRYSGAQVFYAGTEGSENLAQILQMQFITALQPSNNRKIKPADSIYLMQNIQKPGVLVECGFLSNPEEEALLRDPQYQKKLCCVIVSGLSEYINT